MTLLLGATPPAVTTRVGEAATAVAVGPAVGVNHRGGDQQRDQQQTGSQ
jgi:hypothetical protein